MVAMFVLQLAGHLSIPLCVILFRRGPLVLLRRCEGLLGGSGHLLTQYQLYFYPNYNPIRALKGLISGLYIRSLINPIPTVLISQL